jgi:hypothetical protein
MLLANEYQSFYRQIVQTSELASSIDFNNIAAPLWLLNLVGALHLSVNFTLCNLAR